MPLRKIGKVELSKPESGDLSAGRGFTMINLNTATAKELDAIEQLHGHGFEIVSYREERGRFDEVKQLEEVPGLAGKWNGAEKFLRVG